jgi:hypothetical protein
MVRLRRLARKQTLSTSKAIWLIEGNNTKIRIEAHLGNQEENIFINLQFSIFLTFLLPLFIDKFGTSDYN